MTSSPFAVAGIDIMPSDDQLAITATLTSLFTGFALRDVNQLDGIYTDDADWVNAFGSVKHGNREIVDYLCGLFDDENFNDGSLVSGPTSTLKRLADDAVVVSTHLQVSGQGLLEGGTIALRDNRSLHIMSKQSDGSWRIISEMFSDSNTVESYIDHS